MYILNIYASRVDLKLVPWITHIREEKIELVANHFLVFVKTLLFRI